MVELLIFPTSLSVSVLHPARANMQPWTMHKWREWKHQFQFFLATLDQPLEDAQKVTLFRDSLGADGLAVACKLFPELINYNARAKGSHTFAQIWWQFHEQCWTSHRTDSDPASDLLEDRRNLRQICDDAMEKVSLILPS